MKFNFTRASFFLLTALLFSSKLFAQTTADSSIDKPDYVTPFSGDRSFRTWSFGVYGGILSTNTVFQSNDKLDFTSPAQQLGYGIFFKKQLFPSFGLQADFLMGKLSANHSQAKPSGVVPFRGFNTTIHYSASLSANFTLANVNWQHEISGIELFLTTGAGTMNYTPVLTLQDRSTKNFKSGNGTLNEIYVPVGLGVKINVAKGVNVEFGYKVNFVYSDNIDGYKYGTNNDKFSYAHVGVEFAIGKRSSPQLAAHNPVSSMRDEYLWQNQNAKDALQVQVDSAKVKNEELQKQLVAANALLAKLSVDSDGDGVSDFYDKCPNTPAGTKVDGSGCPLPVAKPQEKVTAGDRVVINEALQHLEFSFGKASISERSYATLDKLAQLLIDKNLNLKLAGYTDNVGSDAVNLRVSQGRAEAVKAYLISKGVSASRIEATGYGKANPIASNKTAAGRRLNRRVEFTLY